MAGPHASGPGAEPGGAAPTCLETECLEDECLEASAGVAGQETDSSPWPKRPAWLFSARASVSSHSAISSKPSSRAVRAKPGYISVYSYVSPAIADCKLSDVPPTATPVTGSPTSARKSK